MLGPETTTIDVQRLHEQGGEFIQMPCGQVVPVVAEATLEDMLGLGPGPRDDALRRVERRHGNSTYSMEQQLRADEFVVHSGMQRSSSYTAACSGLLQGSDPLLQLPPYLMCWQG
jgi:hypothetical protein